MSPSEIYDSHLEELTAVIKRLVRENHSLTLEIEGLRKRLEESIFVDLSAQPASLPPPTMYGHGMKACDDCRREVYMKLTRNYCPECFAARIREGKRRHSLDRRAQEVADEVDARLAGVLA